jgi:hypothetical protein
LTRPSGPGAGLLARVENLGFVPSFPWRPPVAGVDPALRAWRGVVVLRGDRLKPVPHRASRRRGRQMLEERLDRVFEGHSDETFAAPKPGPAASRKHTASCRCLLGRLRRLELTRPSGPRVFPM